MIYLIAYLTRPKEKAIHAARELMSTTNIYLRNADTTKTPPHAHILRDIGVYLTQLLRLFGIIADEPVIGLQQAQGQPGLEDAVLPGLVQFADIREQLRKLALKSKGELSWVAGSGFCNHCENAAAELGVCGRICRRCGQEDSEDLRRCARREASGVGRPPGGQGGW